ncbi:RebB family R body protein [Sneathiella limimaris]|uniref:RebB family R body protein n=1 Tax=Sneathiella limimaris TaxID=1964213 RepID=UPI00146B6F86|nr:RebB family R body protein [Sneathiella limimaris]
MTDKKSGEYYDRVTESVVKVNEIVLGSAASTAMATMYITMAQAAGISSLGTVSTQQNRNILGTATIAAGTGNLLWSGMNDQVAELTISERLKNWETMLSVSEGNDGSSKDAQGSEDNQPDQRAEGEPERR